jgi:hypothetical protein
MLFCVLNKRTISNVDISCLYFNFLTLFLVTSFSQPNERSKEPFSTSWQPAEQQQH